MGAILGLVRDGSDWRLDPVMVTLSNIHPRCILIYFLKPMRDPKSPQGEGNVVSVEFNLLYRWHATLSAQDAEWTTQEFSRLFEGKELNKVSFS